MCIRDRYYALTVLRADIPPLRDRETDILRLAESFLAEFRERYDRPQTTMSAEFSEALLDCAWPGNISQLKNVIEHAVLVSAGPQLEASALPEDVLAVRKTQEQGHDLSENVLRAVLARTRNNRSHAAKLLGIGRTTLWRAMKRVGLE